MDKQVSKVARKVTWIGFYANLLLTVFKLIAGFLGRSSAMIADGVHSVSDFSTDLVVVGSLKVASKPSDQNHKYGHGKVETLATAFVGIVLLIVGAGILYSGGKKIYEYFQAGYIESPGTIAFYAAIASIVIKEIIYRYTLKKGKQINSQVVIANAWHHRTDVYSSFGTLAGIGGAIFLGPRWTILDPLAAIIVSIFIFIVSFKILKEAVLELIETSLPEKTEKQIVDIAKKTEGVFDPHNLKTRKIGSNIAIEIHIRVKKNLNVQEAHNITIKLEKKYRNKFGEKTHVSIHTEPLV